MSGTLARLTRAVVLASLSSCAPAGPRALVLVDGADGGAVVDARAIAFEATHHRHVRVLHVEGGAAAMLLASRGEAEVALVPEGQPVGEFLQSHHGEQAGTLALGGGRARVLAVNASQHPTVDGDGAKALSAFLAAGP